MYMRAQLVREALDLLFNLFVKECLRQGFGKYTICFILLRKVGELLRAQHSCISSCENCSIVYDNHLFIATV
jgi:hypothetical protein